MQPLLLTASRYTGYTRRNSRFSFLTGTALVAGKNTNERPSAETSQGGGQNGEEE